MASVGHWDSIAEAEKLTNNLLVSGIVEENTKMGGLIPFLPVAQFSGLKTTWNRESTLPSGANAVSGSQLVWEEAAKLIQVERTARIKYVATLLDHYVEEVHGSFNNYAAIQLMNDKKAMLQKLEDNLIYDDETFGSGTEEMEGLHALAADTTNSNTTNFHGDTLNIDGAEAAPALEDLRILEDNMLHGLDVWVMPKVIARNLDRYVQEQGISTNTFGQIQFTINDVGKKVTHWNGTPIIRSDYLVAEQVNTGAGSDRRAKFSSGTAQYSVFGIKFGQVMRAEPGLTLGFGNKSGQVNAGELWKTVMFEDLEDQDSGGLRLVAYANLMDGSRTSVCRLFDIIDGDWVSGT